MKVLESRDIAVHAGSIVTSQAGAVTSRRCQSMSAGNKPVVNTGRIKIWNESLNIWETHNVDLDAVYSFLR